MSNNDIKNCVSLAINLAIALSQCIKLLRQWHGIECFDIYYKKSPEMKLIRELISYDDFLVYLEKSK